MPPLKLRPVPGERGRELLFVGPRVRIGRSRDNDLVLPDRDSPSSSSHHAEAILDANGVWSLVDTSSSNGTRINGILIQRQALKNGDRIEFGDEQFVVVIAAAPRQPWILTALIATIFVLAAAGFILSRRQGTRTFEAVADLAAKSVYMIAIETGGERALVGSGFAVSADGWLATNAHIADALLRRQALPFNGGSAVRALAIQGDTYEVLPIATARIDPAWKAGSLAHDVALLKLEGSAATSPLRLANQTAIDALARGTPIAAFGFPAVSTDTERPRGRLSVDVVGDVRGDYLEVGLGISPGMSGCPVLNRSGIVVAMVVGGDFVQMPDGIARPSGSSANWALSASTIRALLK